MQLPLLKNKFIVAILFSGFFSFQGIIAGNIIDTTDYSYWRKLSKTSKMFGAMKISAIKTVKSDTIGSRDIMASNSLAYVLDPANRSLYVKNIKNGIEKQINALKIGKAASNSSVPSSELFHGLLALDVIRYDLDPKALAHCESIIEDKIFKLVLTRWIPHGWAMRMLWYKYKGDNANFLIAKRQYDIDLRTHFLPDGVAPAGNGYNMHRFNAIERSAKNQTFDIMEYMGYHEYYSDLGLKNMHEWNYGYTNAPFGHGIFYGDSRGGTTILTTWTTEGNEIVSPTSVRAARFSEIAYKHSMWMLKEGAGLKKPILKGYLASYLVMAGPASKNNPLEFNLDDAEMPPSHIFDNYAALIGNKPSRNALYLSVLSLTGMEEYHTHLEANAIGMAGFGEILLRNAGYDGPNADVSAGGITTKFRFIHENAEAANTLLIGGKNHTGKLANGIKEGFVGEDVEYFRALNNTSIAGEHFRDVIFVQPSNQVEGYYIVMDHVSTQKVGEQINLVWHPNSAKVSTIQDNKAYNSKIEIQEGDKGPVLFGGDKPELTIFLGTNPLSVNKKDMVNQSRGNHYRAQYLYCTYPTNKSKADILTVLFPGDKTHKTGQMTSIESNEYTGSKIVQNQVTDIALISDAKTKGKNEIVSFQGENIFYRHISGKLNSYFVKGLSFDNGEVVRTGFQSDASVSLYLNSTKQKKGMQGKIVSTGTTVTFYCPGISSVLLDGKVVTLLEKGLNTAKINVPIGTYSITIMTNSKK